MRIENKDIIYRAGDNVSLACDIQKVSDKSSYHNLSCQVYKRNDITYKDDELFSHFNLETDDAIDFKQSAHTKLPEFERVYVSMPSEKVIRMELVLKEDAVLEIRYGKANLRKAAPEPKRPRLS